MDRRSRYYAGAPARRSVARARSPQGNLHLRHQRDSSSISPDSMSGNISPPEEHSVSSGSRQNLSKKATGTPMKTLIEEEMSRERKASQASPSVIAKLMGLDSLPPTQALAKQQNENSSCLVKSADTSHKDHSVGLSTRSEHQKFKDVFEIKDPLEVQKPKTQSTFHGNSRPNPDASDVNFVRQKFMEAKRLSTDENLQYSKEFNDALEILDSNKDLFLKLLEEPNSMFTKHLCDVRGISTATQESHVTVLRSSKGKTSEMDVVSYKSNTDGFTQKQKDALSSSRKPATKVFNHLLKEQNDSLSDRLLKSRSAAKNNACHHSTTIVVLKPNSEKHQHMTRKVSRLNTHENYPFGYRRQREFLHSRIQELHAEGRERQNLFKREEVTGHRTKGSREIAREITKRIKHSVSSGPDKVLVSGFNRYTKDDLRGMYNPYYSKGCQQTLDNFECQNGTSSPSTSYSSESPISKEARRRLSERWRMSNRSREVRLKSEGSSTLGEMLAVPDKGVSRNILDSMSVPNVAADKLTRDMLGTHLHSSGSGRRNEDRDLPRSSSLPALSTVHVSSKSRRPRISDADSCYMLKDVLNFVVDESSGGNLNQRRSSVRKSSRFHGHIPHLNPSEEENKLPIKEIHMNQEVLKNEAHTCDHSEGKPVLTELSSSDINKSSNFSDSVPVTGPIISEFSPIIGDGLLHQAKQGKRSLDINPSDETIQEKSPDHPEVGSIYHQCGEETESLIGCKDVEQPSPVSVLEHTPEDGEPSPECFERVSADLKELRMQLQLLRLEQDKCSAECEILAMSEDESEECSSLMQKEEVLHSYINEVERDYSYLLDMLVGMGFHSEHHDSYVDVFCSSKLPIVLDTFEELEEKYKLLAQWSKSERKLFFDVVNSVLEEMFGSRMDQQPWIEPKRKLGAAGSRGELIGDVWQAVVRQQNELGQGKPEEMVLDPRWLDLGDDLDIIGREIEVMLKDELLDELVSTFISK